MTTGYETATQWVMADGRNWKLIRLKDRAQYHDPDGVAAAMGVHENVWPIFGHIWPACSILCEALAPYPFETARVLELGCGLGLVSMVLHERGVDVTASDIHPLAETFLERNCAINGLSRIPFRRLDWSKRYPDLEPFDVIVAADVLYEDGMVEDITAFIDAHTTENARVFVSDPGRSSRRNAFTRTMEAMGWACEEWQFEANVKGRIMIYHRNPSN